jgi:hypothetical protein
MHLHNFATDAVLSSRKVKPFRRSPLLPLLVVYYSIVGHVGLTDGLNEWMPKCALLVTDMWQGWLQFYEEGLGHFS